MRTCLIAVTIAFGFISNALATPLLDQKVLFGKCETEAAADATPGYQDAIPLGKKMPIYPKRALEKGVEAAVLLEFTVTDLGDVVDVVVVDAGITHGGDSLREAFENAAIAAAEQFSYQPATQDGMPVEKKGVQNLVTFYIDWGSETLPGVHFAPGVREILKSMTANRTEKALAQANRRVESAGDDLERAAYLYVKAVVQSAAQDPEGALQSLADSAALLRTIRLNPNAARLLAHAGMMSGTLRAKRGDWESGVGAFREALIQAKRVSLPASREMVLAYANLGSGAAALAHWCEAAESMTAAIDLGNELGMTIPDQWSEIRGYSLKKQSGE